MNAFYSPCLSNGVRWSSLRWAEEDVNAFSCSSSLTFCCIINPAVRTTQRVMSYFFVCQCSLSVHQHLRRYTVYDLSQSHHYPHCKWHRPGPALKLSAQNRQLQKRTINRLLFLNLDNSSVIKLKKTTRPWQEPQQVWLLNGIKERMNAFLLVSEHIKLLHSTQSWKTSNGIPLI